MALVLKKWSCQNTPDANGNFAHLIGREAGLLAWLLSVLGIDATTEIEIKENVVVFSKGSLEGTEKRVIPLPSVCSAYYGFKKPWKEALVITILLTPVFFIGLLLGPLYYFLNKTLTVGIVEHSSWIGGFAFKRSVIEGKSISEQDAWAVIQVIRALLERQAPTS